MSFDFPWSEFLAAQQMRNQYSQRASDQLAQGASSIGDIIAGIRQMRNRDALTQASRGVTNAQLPVQGPSLPGAAQMPQGITPRGSQPGQPIPGAMDAAQAKMEEAFGRVYPELYGGIMEAKMNPYKQALTMQAQAEAEKARRPPKPPMEFAAIPGILTKNGQPVFVDKTTGATLVGKVPGGVNSTGFGSTMGPIRKSQYTMQDLPSNMGPSTAPGAAYQVKLAARQGMKLISKPGSFQRTGLAQGDLARAIIRAAPTEEAMHNANFSDNVVTKWAALKQKLTADPKSVNNTAIRREIYDIFKEMDESASPWIKNQLDDMASVGFPVSEAVVRRQMGLTIPDVPFVDDAGSGAGGIQGWGIKRTDQ